MGNTSTLPVVSQAKSVVQLVTGDAKGALETQEKFLHECPVVAQVTSVTELIIDGDTKKFEETNKRSGKLVLNTIDGIPVAGHIKAGIHLLADDKEGAAQAFNSANRSSGVIAGGVGGFLVGGPVGAVAGGVAGGAAADGIKTGIDSAIHKEYRPSGTLAAVQHAVDNPSGGAIFDAIAVPVFDGVAGYGAGQITAKVQAGLTKAQLAKTMAKRDAAQAILDEGIFDGKMTSGEAQAAGQGVNQMTAQITALEGKLGVPEVFVDPKTGITHTIVDANAIPGTTAGQCATVGTAMTEADVIDLEALLTKMETRLKQKKSVDSDQLKDLISRIANQLAPAAYAEVVLQMLKAETAEQSEGKLRKKVRVITRQVRRYLRVKKGKKVEDSDSDSSDDEDGELNCVHWNICGISAQLASALGFVWFIVARSPDVILLNEIKASDQVLADLTTLIGYRYVNHPSVAPNNRAMRGSAILYRARPKKFTCLGGRGNGLMERNGAHEIETTWADFKLKSGQMYRLVSCYVLKDSELHFTTAAAALQEIAGGHNTVVAGDLNMKKIEFGGRWSDAGFIDCVKPEWITNVQGTSSSAIDYVMTSVANLHHVLVHKPIRPLGTNLHLLVPFTVGPHLEDYQWCENSTCSYGCTQGAQLRGLGPCTRPHP